MTFSKTDDLIFPLPWGEGRVRGFILTLAFMLMLAPFVHASSSSPNYSLESNFPSAGGSEIATSTHYKVEEGLFDWIHQRALSSTNYGVDGSHGSNASSIPTFDSVTPGDYGHFYASENASYAISATSPDSDPLQYEGIQDGTSKVGPQTSSTLSWGLSLPDKGRHNVKLKVIDPDGNVVKSQSMYAYRRPSK